MADVRAAETSSASYQGSRPRATQVGTGIGFKWTPEIEEAVTELGRGDNCAIIILVSSIALLQNNQYVKS